jgi:hypothetical protein
LPKKVTEKEEQYDRAHGDEGPFGQDQYIEHHEKDEEIRGVDEAAAQCERNRRADDDRDRGVGLPLAELFDGLQSVFGLTEFNVFGLVLVFGGNGGFLGVGFGLGARLVVAVDEAKVGWRRHRYRISLLGSCLFAAGVYVRHANRVAAVAICCTMYGKACVGPTRQRW